MKRLWWELAGWPIGLALWAYTRLVFATCRVTSSPAPREPAIFVNWHQHLPVTMAVHGAARRWMMMSPSPYMAPIARWARLIGLQLIRGTGGAGGRAALAALEAKLRSGESVVLAVDGPAGPAFELKPGCLDLARATGAPIVAVSYRAAHGLALRWRWDRSLFVRPFDELEIIYSAPVTLDAAETPDEAHRRVVAALPPRPPLA